MPENKSEKMEVEILHVREYTVGPLAGPKSTLHDVLFRYAELPPLLVTIPAAEDTPEHRAEVIRKKIEAEKERKPEIIEV